MSTLPKRCGTCRAALRYKWADGTTVSFPVKGVQPWCPICGDAKGTNMDELNTVRLETREGNLVTEIAVLPFDPPADVLLWGVRAFLRAPGVITNNLPVYREGFLYVVTST